MTSGSAEATGDTAARLGPLLRVGDVVALFGRLGEVDVLPPFVGAWAPVVLAILFAVNRLTTLRT